jgi:hypothetical protein
VALNVQRRSGPANPKMIPVQQRGWLRSPSAAWQPMRAGTGPPPAVVAAQRFDHVPSTDRSRGHRLVHRSIARHYGGPAAAGVVGQGDLPAGAAVALGEAEAAQAHPGPGLLGLVDHLGGAAGAVLDLEGGVGGGAAAGVAGEGLVGARLGDVQLPGEGGRAGAGGVGAVVDALVAAA